MRFVEDPDVAKKRAEERERAHLQLLARLAARRRGSKILRRQRPIR